MQRRASLRWSYRRAAEGSERRRTTSRRRTKRGTAGSSSAEGRPKSRDCHAGEGDAEDDPAPVPHKLREARAQKTAGRAIQVLASKRITRTGSTDASAGDGSDAALMVPREGSGRRRSSSVDALPANGARLCSRWPSLLSRWHAGLGYGALAARQELMAYLAGRPTPPPPDARTLKRLARRVVPSRMRPFAARIATDALRPRERRSPGVSPSRRYACTSAAPPR